MATLNYWLDTRSARADGTYALRLSVNTRQGNFLVTTGVYLKKDCWNKGLRCVVKDPRRLFLNDYLREMLIRLDNTLLDEQRRSLHALSFSQIKQIANEVFHGKSNDERTVAVMFEKIQQDASRSPRTREMYKTTWHKIEAYIGEEAAQRLLFEDITPGWLSHFDTWMATDCPKANARAIHMRNLRSVFNQAINDEITTNYPFRKFQIKKEATRKRALTVEQLRWLRQCPLEDWQKKYVDTFFLMFYLMGINAIDLLTAKPSQIVDGRLEYQRAKTGTLYSVKLEPEALEIIERYKGKKYLLNFCDRYKNYKDFMAKMNNCLDSLIPGCTSYYARHSVATIAAELDIPLDTIARMLGHTDPSRRITLIYVDFDQSKVDNANRKVIDYTLYNKKEK